MITITFGALTPQVERVLDIEHTGFRRSSSTVDIISNLHVVCEKICLNSIQL